MTTPSGVGAVTLVVQTQAPHASIEHSPVAAYLSAALGEPVRIESRGNVLAHWRRLASGERPSMVFEDPHFADYRVTRAGYRIVAAESESQAFSLAAGGFLVLDPSDLAGRPVAALPPPALSTLQLLAFFPGAVRIPRIIESASFAAAAGRVMNNEAVAAVLPADELPAYPDLKGMLHMEELPGKAFLLAPELPDAVAERIVSALVLAREHEQGRLALASLGVPAFARAHREAYGGYARLLKGSWGFREIRP